MTRDLLLEIGTEEIPAGYLPPAMRQLEELARKEFSAARLFFGEIRGYATPRRLVLHITKVAEAQESAVREILGPARGVAYDVAGNPTKAAEGFARSQGVDIGKLKVVSTPKGEYVAAVKEEEGRPAAEVLVRIVPGLITSLHFPKFQRWGSSPLRFARPIRWILCLFGSEVVPFNLDGIRAGRSTRGHRFMAPGPFEVKDAKDFFRVLRKGKVILEPEERREAIREAVREAAAEAGGKPVGEENLLEEVVYLVEYPVVLRGQIDKKYLALPREVLVTSMRSHQRYFPVEGRGGKLKASFITVSNNKARDPGVVVAGNERVLRARLEDGMFFFSEDLKISLAERVEQLKTVVFQEKLGTSWEKMERFSALARDIAKKVAPEALDEVGEVAFLCKGDLVTHMVGEFAELQGVMGREYALAEGKGKAVADGILEHYYPRFSGDRTPATLGGAVVSIADRLDTICGCFGIGITPTGTADPYALRRHALGIIAILMDRGWRVDLRGLLKASLKLLEGKTDIPEDRALAGMEEFFRGRLHNLLTGRGSRHDLVTAVIQGQWADPVDAAARVKALGEFSRKAGFADLMMSFKRVMNIIPEGFGGEVDPKLLVHPAERELLEASRKVAGQVGSLLGGGDYPQTLKVLAELKKPVDAFFDGVLVMDKDPAVKANRLALLAGISGLFARVADFRKVVTE